MTGLLLDSIKRGEDGPLSVNLSDSPSSETLPGNIKFSLQMNACSAGPAGLRSPGLYPVDVITVFQIFRNHNAGCKVI